MYYKKSATSNFYALKGFQKHHFGAKAPLLDILRLRLRAGPGRTIFSCLLISCAQPTDQIFGLWLSQPQSSEIWKSQPGADNLPVLYDWYDWAGRGPGRLIYFWILIIVVFISFGFVNYLMKGSRIRARNSSRRLRSWRTCEFSKWQRISFYFLKGNIQEFDWSSPHEWNMSTGRENRT